jgi:ubiquinone/menaquinone biosynthesis C-methylase UbiE
MRAFIRDDGSAVRILDGFREQILGYRASVTPRPGWSEAQYVEAAHRKRRRWERLVAELSRWGVALTSATVLDVGCGDGANCLLSSQARVRQVTGIDLQFPLLATDEKGERTRHLARHLLSPGTDRSSDPSDPSDPSKGSSEVARDLERALRRLPLKFLAMDATRMAFEDESFDLVISRSAMEHIRPIERGVHEIARVARGGGVIYLAIDPFYWVRGCHKRGVVDIPFAHARLTASEYHRYAKESEGEAAADVRTGRLETLNRLTVGQWHSLIEAERWDILDWNERRSETGERLLQDHPDIAETLLPGVEVRDLVCERIEVILRKRGGSARHA